MTKNQTIKVRAWMNMNASTANTATELAEECIRNFDFLDEEDENFDVWDWAVEIFIQSNE